MPAINNQVIMAALIANGSVRTAAKTAGVSEATIRARLSDPEFRQQYEKAKNTILSEACDALAARLTLAIDTICEVLNDDKAAATVKISAADSLLRHGLRYIETASILRRIEALEAEVNTKER